MLKVQVANISCRRQSTTAQSHPLVIMRQHRWQIEARLELHPHGSSETESLGIAIKRIPWLRIRKGQLRKGCDSMKRRKLRLQHTWEVARDLQAASLSFVTTSESSASAYLSQTLALRKLVKFM